VTEEAQQRVPAASARISASSRPRLLTPAAAAPVPLAAATAVPRRAVAWFAARDVTARRVLSPLAVAPSARPSSRGRHDEVRRAGASNHDDPLPAPPRLQHTGCKQRPGTHSLIPSPVSGPPFAPLGGLVG
jgi:hypothetical protein